MAEEEARKPLDKPPSKEDCKMPRFVAGMRLGERGHIVLESEWQNIVFTPSDNCEEEEEDSDEAGSDVSDGEGQIVFTPSDNCEEEEDDSDEDGSDVSDGEGQIVFTPRDDSGESPEKKRKI